MCGVFAVLSLTARLPEDASERIGRVLEVIKHRGPDARGQHVDPQGRFAFGHVRLAVIDIVAESNQPFWSACGRYCLVFNGEIFNYVELRAELEAQGAEFRTHSDTEVLLQALIRWGPRCFNRFNGMWSAIFGDTKTGKFVISRDRFGVKPLHTYIHQGTLVVCSEAKGIFAYTGCTPPPEHSSIGLFLKFGTGGEHPLSWFKGVERFPQASYQELELGGGQEAAHRTTRFWEYPTQRTIVNTPEAVEEFERILMDAIRIRLRSDMPIGLSLSGGLDSGALAWLISAKCNQQLETYTAWHEPVEKSELPTAQRVASMFGHKSTAVPQARDEDTMDDLRTCIWHLDSGHTSPAIVPYFNLCRAARKSLTVMIEGQGADELLCGYTQFALFAGMDRLLSGRVGQFATCCRSVIYAEGWARFAKDCARFLSSSLYERQANRWHAGQILSAEANSAEPHQLHHIDFNTNNLNRELLFSHSHGLTNLLQYGDAVSMAVSLETRCPFMDYRMVEFGFKVQPDLLIANGYGKSVLRRCAEHGLPDDICWRRKKDGFTNATTRIVKQVVERGGLPKAGLNYALESGLLRAELNTPRILNQLPSNILFRLVSVLLWAESFYTDASEPGVPACMAAQRSVR